MQHELVNTPAARPSRAQIEPAALALLSRHSAGLLATARRYSVTPEDAEDAYQRGVEILLTKAPTTTEDELLPWLRTVVKHEAFAVRKSTGRAVPSEEPVDGEPDLVAWTDERAERYERLRLGAEAMAGLKPQEIRCLLLKAEGLSYREICEVTNFSYTKVNRCITEGRRAFLERVAHIESGAECERLAPLLSKIADGEAGAAEMREVRPHLKGCLSCKATLREYRATPSRLAGLVPPVAVLAGGSDGSMGFVARMLQAVQDRFGDVAGAKAAAVAASAVVLAGGGAAGVEALDHDPPRVPASAFASAAPPTRTPPAAAPAHAAPASESSSPDPVVVRSEPAASASAPADPDPAQSADRGSDPTTPAPSPEFDPGTTGAAAGGSPPSGSGAAAAAPPASAAPAAQARRGDRQAAEFGP